MTDVNQQDNLERLASRMYEEIRERMADPVLSAVVKHRITALYGPPMLCPDLALVTFQGGGADRSEQRWTWPDDLLYLHDKFPFGIALRRQFAAATLYETLERRTVAIATCFPEAPRSEADKWEKGSGPFATWREFSVAWVRRMLHTMQPRIVIVFGERAGRVLGLHWREVERRGSDNHRTYARTEIEGIATVYCQHLSQGYSTLHVQRSLRVVKSMLQCRA